jgi:hypothetical protein
MEEGWLEGWRLETGDWRLETGDWRLETVKLEDLTLEHYRFTIFSCYLERSIDQLTWRDDDNENDRFA